MRTPNGQNYPEVEFGFDPEWELHNWYQTCAQKVTYGINNGADKWGLGDIPAEVAEIVLQEPSKENAIGKIRPIFTRFIQTSEASEKIKQITERAKKRWNKVAERYFTILSRMIEVPMQEFEKKYFAFFTFSRRCPFHNNKFMFSQFNDFSNSAAHEIMHIEFLKKYARYCLDKGLSELQLSHLKEILTVLLNVETLDLLYHPDYGYEKHKELRSRTVELYKQKKSGKKFIYFLDKVIDLVRDHIFQK